MLLLFLNNFMCSQAFSQISTTLYVDKSSVYPYLHLQEICISVTKCSWHLKMSHLFAEKAYNLQVAPLLLIYYFLCPLEVLWTAYPSYFVFNVISKLASTMERRKIFFFLCLLNSQKGEFLTMLHELFIKVQEKKAKLLFFLGKKTPTTLF